MKKCSTSLAIKEMQSKTMLRFHLILVRMAIIKNTNNNNAGKDAGWKGEQERNSHTLLGM
jgi:hypothetical protein